VSARIVTLAGDGIGPEIMAPTLTLLGELGTFEFEEHVFGGGSIDAHGMALTEETLAACRDADDWPGAFYARIGFEHVEDRADFLLIKAE